MKKQEYTFKVEVEIDEDTGQIILTIPQLDNISSFGNTFTEAEANIIEASVDYIQILHKERTPIPEASPLTEGICIKLLVPDPDNSTA